MSSISPLAVELNDAIRNANKYVFDMLSEFGFRIYFPKGILSQSAEARAQASKANATIGIATEQGEPMHLPSIQRYISGIAPNDSFDYAPAAGKPELRALWRKKILDDNPSLRGKALSNPVVTSGLTHGLSITGDLFVNPKDIIILPDKVWDNYPLMFSVRYGAQIKTFPLYNEEGGFNTIAFRNTLADCARLAGKVLIILNFPNNPTGYTVTVDEAKEIADAIYEIADTGCNIISICDDAYFGLFYDDNALKESISGYLTGLHPRVLTIKVDGASKEEYAWGLRVGFITFGLGDSTGKDGIFNALERKVMGTIRSSISNCSNLSQTLVLEALKSPVIAEERAKKAQILKSRAMMVKKVLEDAKYKSAWDVYPFNSGYFMCLRLKSVSAEQLRRHLLQNYGVGVIAMEGSDLRIAFSCIEEENIQELFDTIYKGVKDLSAS